MARFARSSPGEEPVYECIIKAADSSATAYAENAAGDRRPLLVDGAGSLLTRKLTIADQVTAALDGEAIGEVIAVLREVVAELRQIRADTAETRRLTQKIEAGVPAIVDRAVSDLLEAMKGAGLSL